jgi:hypothetical protein
MKIDAQTHGTPAITGSLQTRIESLCHELIARGGHLMLLGGTLALLSRLARDVTTAATGMLDSTVTVQWLDRVEQSLAVVNELVSTLPLAKAIAPASAGTPIRVLVVQVGQAIEAESWRLLGRLISSFPGLNLRLILLSETPCDEVLAALGTGVNRRLIHFSLLDELSEQSAAPIRFDRADEDNPPGAHDRARPLEPIMPAGAAFAQAMKAARQASEAMAPARPMPAQAMPRSIAASAPEPGPRPDQDHRLDPSSCLAPNTCLDPNDAPDSPATASDRLRPIAIIRLILIAMLMDLRQLLARTLPHRPLDALARGSARLIALGHSATRSMQGPIGRALATGRQGIRAVCRSAHARWHIRRTPGSGARPANLARPAPRSVWTHASLALLAIVIVSWVHPRQSEVLLSVLRDRPAAQHQASPAAGTPQNDDLLPRGPSLEAIPTVPTAGLPRPLVRLDPPTEPIVLRPAAFHPPGQNAHLALSRLVFSPSGGNTDTARPAARATTPDIRQTRPQVTMRRTMTDPRQTDPAQIIRNRQEHEVSFNEKTGKAQRASHLQEAAPEQRTVTSGVEALPDASPAGDERVLEATSGGENRVHVPLEPVTATPSPVAEPTAFAPLPEAPAFVLATPPELPEALVTAETLSRATPVPPTQVESAADPATAQTAAVVGHAGQDAAAVLVAHPADEPQAMLLNTADARAELVFPPADQPAALLVSLAPTVAVERPAARVTEVATPGAEAPAAAPAPEAIEPVRTVVPVEPAAPATGATIKVSLSSASMSRLVQEEAQVEALRQQIDRLSDRVDARRRPDNR